MDIVETDCKVVLNFCDAKAFQISIYSIIPLSFAGMIIIAAFWYKDSHALTCTSE